MRIKTLLGTLLLLLLVTSCCDPRFISLTQRHYRSGFYVDTRSHAHRPDGVTGTRSRVEQEQVLSSFAEPTAVASAPVKSGTSQTGTEVVVTNETAHGHEPGIVKQTSHLLLKKAHQGVLMPMRLSGMHRDSDDPGYFLWTIIAILIVIWLISLLTGGWGLGGLIYIFLVVALVLLLLRLLSIL